MKKESIFTVTFTDGGEVFIQAMDEGHARRIVETNNVWRWNTEDEGHARTVRKIEKNYQKAKELAKQKAKILKQKAK